MLKKRSAKSVDFFSEDMLVELWKSRNSRKEKIGRFWNVGVKEES